MKWQSSKQNIIKTEAAVLGKQTQKNPAQFPFKLVFPSELVIHPWHSWVGKVNGYIEFDFHARL